MSFEIYIDTFENEQSRRIPASEVAERFSSVIDREHLGYWKLTFQEGPSYAEIAVPRESMIQGFVVHNPPPYLEFWKVIAGFLKDLNCVLYWPGGGAVIARLEVLAELPKDMVETLGIPWVTTDPEQIRKYVGKSQ